MPKSVEFTMASHEAATSPCQRSDYDATRISQLMSISAISMAGLVIAVIASSLVDASQHLGFAIAVASLGVFVTTIWLAFKVYRFLGAVLVLVLLLVTSLAITLPPIAPFAFLGKLFIFLSVRGSAARVLKRQQAQRNSTQALSARHTDEVCEHSGVSRFSWERWLVPAVIAVLLGMVAYSAYQSILEASL